MYSDVFHFVRPAAMQPATSPPQPIPIYPLKLNLPAVVRPETVFPVLALVLGAGSGRGIDGFFARVCAFVIHGLLQRKLVDVQTSLRLEHLGDHAPMTWARGGGGRVGRRCGFVCRRGFTVFRGGSLEGEKICIICRR